jgi:tetratricopeptide (TPR) repeat protein
MNDARAKLEAGLRYHQSGNLAAAEHLYRQVLQDQPGNADALYLLGTAAQQAGQPEAAAAYLQRAIKRDRRNPIYHLALGDARQAQGKAKEAMAAYNRALALAPGRADPHFSLGNLAHAKGKLQDAVKHYRRALKIDPKLAEAHNNLGVALTTLGRLAEAAKCFERALELKPNYADAHLNHGQALKADGRIEEAIEAYHRALKLDPRLAEARNNLGTALRDQGKPEAAVEELRAAIQMRPNYPDAHNNLGIALCDLGRFDDGLAAHQRALELRPDDADAHAGLGAIHQILGDQEAATRHYQRALEIRPDHARAHHNLAMARESMVEAGEIDRLQALLQNQSLLEREATALRFALAKLCEDAGRFDDAFAHLTVANQLKRSALGHQGQRFDAARHRAFVDQLIATFDRRYFQDRDGYGDPSERPVLIVGMPRSGTSLVEQILASHSRVFGAGELDDLGRLVEGLRETLGSDRPYPACADQIDQAAADRIATSYLDKLRALEPGAAPGAARVTDKLPGNFLHLGVLAVALPQARVIHCRRDPLDTCVSCYAQSFKQPLTYAYDLTDLGHYFGQYRRLMTHWRAQLPLALFEVDYEDLVADQERVSRELIGFCGLEWEPACLAFHQTKRPVRTASLNQVRRPIYGSSVGRWRNFDRHLTPLKAALAEDQA